MWIVSVLLRAALALVAPIRLFRWYLALSVAGSIIAMYLNRHAVALYQPWWIIKSVGLAVGNVMLVRDALKRLDVHLDGGWWGIAWLASCGAAVSLLHRPRVWPGSHLELWEVAFGVVSLWLGMVTAIGFMAARVSIKTSVVAERHAMILAAYLLMDAVCLFPASAYPHIGQAGSIATTLCYAAWIAVLGSGSVSFSSPLTDRGKPS